MSKQSHTLCIEGMTCQGCVKSIKDIVSDISGVESIDVNLETKRALLSFDTTQVAINEIIEQIEDAGFDAAVID